MSEFPTFMGSRITLLCDGDVLLGASVVTRPDGAKELAALLRELADMIESPGETIFDSECPE